MRHITVLSQAVDLSTLSNTALEAEIATCSASLDAAEHRLLTLIRELDSRQRHRDHGLPSAAAWLGWRIGLGAGAAREKVRVANALGQLPQIDAALASGNVSYSKVRAMTRIATPSNEAKLLHMATRATAAQLERICRGVAQVTTTTKAGTSRWLRTVPDTDGMVRIEARLHADEAALVMKSLELARDVSAQVGPSRPTSPSKPDRADALVQVAESYIAGQRADARPASERHQLIVCVREEPLAPGGVSAETDPIDAQVPADTLRRLACDTSITRVTVDDDATPLDVGRKTRVISTPMRRALLLRDGACRFPGCTNRRWLDAHHIDHWIDGGETSRDNLILLCPRHHQLLHEGGFGLRRTSDGLAFVRPDGTIVDSVPACTPAALCAVTAPRPPCHPGPVDYNMAIGVIAPCRTRVIPANAA